MFIYVISSHLYLDRNVNSLHKSYKQCIADEVSKYMEGGSMPAGELCVEQREKFYLALHEGKKLEHDNIMKYVIETLKNQDI